jgi:hypothetical protein
MIPNTITPLDNRRAEIDGLAFTLPYAKRKTGFVPIFAQDNGKIIRGEVLADKEETLWDTAEYEC